MKHRVMKAIIQGVLLVSKALALDNREREVKETSNNLCKHIHGQINNYDTENFSEMPNAVFTKSSEALYTLLAVKPEATEAYSKHTKHHQPIQIETTVSIESKTVDVGSEAGYMNTWSRTKTSQYLESDSEIRSLYASSTTLDSDPTVTSGSIVVTSLTTARTSSHSTSTNTISTTSPLSTFPVCPYFDGYCLGAATTLPPLFYIRCDRSLVDDATTNYNCAPQPSLEYEGSCNQACFDDPTCKAWSGSYQVPGVGFPNGTYDCCHIYEEITLRSDVPAPVDGPIVPFSGSSYGVRGACPLGATNMCPYYDSQCVEGIQIHCGRALGIDSNSDPQPSDWTDDQTQYSCHQSCVEDPNCTAWDGWNDIGDIESGGAGIYNCFHYNSTFVLNPNIPPGRSIEGYGVKGC